MIYVVTYATHSFGNYEEMINNKYGIKFKVIGWGKEWNGYMAKLKAVYEFIKTLKDDDIIVQLDGFDVWINGNLSTAIKYFKKGNHKVLFSQELDHRFFGLQPYLNKKIFSSTCRNNKTINAGMYMGYKKYLIPIIKRALESQETDDQRIFNMLCGEFMNKNILAIDEKCKIFQNVDEDEKIKKSKSVFVQFPGKPSIQRWSRGVTDYAKYIKTELCILFIVLSIIIYLIVYLSKKININ